MTTGPVVRSWRCLTLNRGSLLTAVVLRAISEFTIETRQMQEDCTPISVQGL